MDHTFLSTPTHGMH